MDEEPVVTRDFGRIPAFLIEARSIGGLSGSPVFVNLGTSVLIDGSVKLFKGPLHLFLGIVHGHYDVTANKIDGAQDGNLYTAQVNMGIAAWSATESASFSRPGGGARGEGDSHGRSLPWIRRALFALRRAG